MLWAPTTPPWSPKTHILCRAVAFSLSNFSNVKQLARLLYGAMIQPLLRASRACILLAGRSRRLRCLPSATTARPAPQVSTLRSFASRKSRKSPPVAPPEAPPQPPAIQLRDYQRECIESVVCAFKEGHKRVGISLATGGGKTVIFTQLIQHVQPPSDGATQTLILAHRRELVEQAARHCFNTYPDKTVEIDMANAHASGFADITVASVASLQREERLSKYNPKHFKLVLVDEAHHIVAPGYTRVLHHFGLSQKQEGSPNLVGVSATFSRFDGLRLGSAIDEIVYHKDYVDMIDEKWLTGVLFTTVHSTADITKVRKAGAGDFIASELSDAVNTDEVNTITVRSWLAKAADRKSTLVFCVDLRHVGDLTTQFRQHGIDARFVTGDTDKIERGEILDAFKRGDFPVLLNCGVFTEGTDIPNIDCIVLARPTRSRNLLVQMIGRGMRLHKDKENCHVIDMVASLETGIVTVPSLFGLDPSEVVTEANAVDLKNAKQRGEAEEERHSRVYEQGASDAALSSPLSPFLNGSPSTKVTFTEYDSVYDLIADTSGEHHINSLSQYAWVRISEFKYILSSSSGAYIRLQKEKDDKSGRDFWFAWLISKIPNQATGRSPYAAPRKILQAPDLTDAVHGADHYAQRHFPHIIISRKASWRYAQATEGQIKWLNKLRPEDNQLTSDDIKKGKATDMIIKVKFGAQAQFTKYQTAKRRHDRQLTQLQQERQRRLNEVVTVGPLKA